MVECNLPIIQVEKFISYQCLILLRGFDIEFANS